MILQRSELELTYLRHQQRKLRELYPGTLESEIHPVPTDDFYDDYRLMVHCPEIQRFYELLYPRDEKEISSVVLGVAGEAALHSLWCDRGRSDGERISFVRFGQRPLVKAAAELLASYDLGDPRDLVMRGGLSIELRPVATQRFADRVYPHVHVSMRRGLKNGVR